MVNLERQASFGSGCEQEKTVKINTGVIDDKLIVENHPLTDNESANVK